MEAAASSIAKACGFADSPRPLGVSVHHLDTVFFQRVIDAGLTEGSSFYDIDRNVVRPTGKDVESPEDGKLGASYVNCLKGVDHVGPSTYMLSWAWKYSVADVVDTLVAYCNKNNLDRKRTYIWICCLCINQHRVVSSGGSGIFKLTAVNFEAEFRTRVLKIGHVLVMMTPWENPYYLQRLWCIFELLTAIINSVPVTIVMPPKEAGKMITEIVGEDGQGAERFFAALQHINIEAAGASCKRDKIRILKLVQSELGFYGTNVRISRHLREWIKETIKRTEVKILDDDKTTEGNSSVSLLRRATLLYRLGDYEGALDDLKASLEARESQAGRRNLEIAVIYELMGSVNAAKCRNDPTPDNNNRSLELQVKALKIREQILGPSHPLVAKSLNSLGYLHMIMGRYGMALACYQRCLSIRIDCLGRLDPDTAAAYLSKGHALKEQGKYSEAIHMCREAVLILEELRGSNHKETAAGFNSLGLVLAFAGYRTRSLAMLSKGLTIRRAVLGNVHLTTAESHGALAQTFLMFNELGRALEHRERSRAIQEKLLGRDHPEVASTYEGIAKVLMKAGCYAKAAKMYRGAHGIYFSSLGEYHVQTLKMKEMTSEALSQDRDITKKWFWCNIHKYIWFVPYCLLVYPCCLLVRGILRRLDAVYRYLNMKDFFVSLLRGHSGELDHEISLRTFELGRLFLRVSFCAFAFGVFASGVIGLVRLTQDDSPRRTETMLLPPMVWALYHLGEGIVFSCIWQQRRRQQKAIALQSMTLVDLENIEEVAAMPTYSEVRSRWRLPLWIASTGAVIALSACIDSATVTSSEFLAECYLMLLLLALYRFGRYLWKRWGKFCGHSVSNKDSFKVGLSERGSTIPLCELKEHWHSVVLKQENSQAECDGEVASSV
ncbi:Kinesin light chain [Seminavis robusta]|uniref:Kinesin light chain n=1 Tax=Seminavis robusta TaxID=568900 RepID=A0A9N8EGB3_9STRA|nr:Kinesin light chain [Seminavis robusta]|eukprot:Sro903_g218230.1 Kinesin light chain (892) ;mRNA; r:10797-13547